MSVPFTWFGPATIGLDVAGKLILVDPFLTDNPSAMAKPETLSPDYIWISHGHGDHMGGALAIAQRCGATVISNFEIASLFESKGVTTHAQHIGGGHRHPFGYLKPPLALHGSALPDGSDGGNPVGFLLTTPDGIKIYLACDTGLFGDMRLIGEEGVALAVLPIGDNYTMGPDDALRAVKLIRPRHVIPIPYSTFDLSAQAADAWAARVRSETDAQAHVLMPGESFTLE